MQFYTCVCQWMHVYVCVDGSSGVAVMEHNELLFLSSVISIMAVERKRDSVSDLRN